MRKGLAVAMLCITALVPADASAAAAPAQARPRVGTVSIPRLNLVSPVYSGTSDAVYDLGVGHWPGTALPGQRGNVVLGGHRTVSPRPFLDIQNVLVGDSIILRRGGRTHEYVVTRTLVVKPTAVWILNQSSGRTLTIFTCHPKGSTRQRYVVMAKLRT